MIKRTILSSAFIIFSINVGISCDACGCSVSTGGIGLLPQMHYNFVGFRWQHTVFQSIEGYDKGDETRDQFNQFEFIYCSSTKNSNSLVYIYTYSTIIFILNFDYFFFKS